ncbi:hypothetical protein Bca101_035942 [Brassica carinata]
MSTTRKRARPEPQSLKKQAPERKTPGRFRRSRCFQTELCQSTLTKSSKECESLLKEEAAKFEQIHHKFMKEKADHLEGLKGLRSISPLVLSSITLKLIIVSKFEENKERLYMRYEQLRKKEKTMISDLERFCTKKLAQLEESLKKKKRVNK